MADQTFEDREPHVAGDPAGDPADGGAPQELQDLRRERDELHDRLLRTAAEFENYRKRVERDRRELAEFAAADALGDMLSIVDNLERALQASPSGDPEALRKGVELIHRQMVDLLHKRGARPIESLGADFNPALHQAVVHEASDQHREGEVMEEMQRGYMLGGRLLRPAMVKVAKSS